LVNQHFSKYKRVVHKKGDMIIRGGEEPSGAYYLKKGYVKMSYIFENGVEIIFNIFKPGSLFPIIWVIGDVENSYHFQAMTNVEITWLSKNEVNKILADNPDILSHLMKRLVVGFDGLLLNIRQMLFGNSVTRVCSAIYIMSKRFGKKRRGGKVLVGIKLTHQDIASISGITRETASIAIKKLEREGVIKQQGGYMLVNNVKRLEQSMKDISNISVSPIPDA